MKILNLYSGIGGNRKLWGDCEVTAVEHDLNIAEIYKANFPQDVIVTGDAHAYLLEHFQRFDFIWSSPPCPTHSRLRTGLKSFVYPDMRLYEEIIFLKHWFKGFWCIENVIPYYTPLIQPTVTIHRHYFWSNFEISDKDVDTFQSCDMVGERSFLEKRIGFDSSRFVGVDKRKVLRNCVLPEVGLHIFSEMRKHDERSQCEL
jgi:DNA (cytosine-5)-methyltransferase 1